MKSILRLGLLVAVLALLVTGVSAPARAQGGVCAFGADDCALLEKVAGNSASVKSFVIESLSVKFAASGLPNNTPDINFEVSGSGGLDASGIAADAMADPAAVLKGLKAALKLTASATGAAAAAQSIDLELRIVDNWLYLNAGQATGGTWIKFGLDKAMAAGGAMSGGMNPMMAQSMMSNPAVANFIVALTTMEGVATGAVTDGPTIDGVATKSFTTSISLDALVKGLTSEEFRPKLKELLAAFGQTIPDSQLAQLSMLSTMLEPTLKATTFTITQYIDPAGANMHGIMIVFDTTVDPSLAAMAGGAAGGSPIKVSFSLDFQMSKLGEPVAVEPVADAADMSSMMGGSK